jgi:membrane protease YdiL (CAAX protease family)
MQQLLPDLSLGVVPMLQDIVRGLPLIVAFPVFALLPGVSEELMFRGLLQNAAARRTTGIAVSALAFSLFHLDPHHVAGVLPLGFFLAWVASRCGTFVTIVAHVLNNSAAIAAVHSQTFDVGYGTDEPMPWQWLPVSWLFVAGAARVIVRASAPPGTPPHGDPAPGTGQAA